MRDITCYIVDDESKAANHLEYLIGNFTELQVIGKETNANRAIRGIISKRPDIVFLDVEMPVKSGFDIIAELRQINCHTTFIMVTAYDHYSIKAIKESAFDYLLKPVDIDELRASIARYKREKKIATNKTLDRNWLAAMQISPREEEIIRLLVEGKTSVEVAEELFISKHTVDTHRKSILHKTGFDSTNMLISFVLKNLL